MLVQGRIDGWTQVDANTGRGRNSVMDSLVLQPDLIKSYGGMQMIPHSLVMPVYSLNFCGLSANKTGEVVVCFGRDGRLSPNYVKVPQEYSLVDVLPVIDEKFGYFTVRRNSSDGVYFVLRSSVSEMTNQILFETKTNNEIRAMVLTDDGLIFASGIFLVNVDRNTGAGNWIVKINGIQNGCQFLYDISSSIPTLYVLHSNGMVAIHPQTGMQLSSTKPGFQVNLSSKQSFLTVGKDLLAIPEIGFNHRISIVDKNNLERGIVAYVVLHGRNGNIDLSRCSNVISRDTSSLFLVCKNADMSFSAFRYDTSNGTISFGYEINTNTLFGIPPKVCSSQIAAFSKTGFYGMACDVGLVAFHQDETPIPRREIHIDIAPETQVFGTLGRFALITITDEGTLLEYVNTQY